jgi:hypothetical protein
MANQIIIDIGAVANDGTGDPLRTAFGYVNNNFSNIWTTGVANSNISFSGNKILTTNTNGNLVLAPNGIGKVQSNVDIVPNANNTLNLGSLALKWNTIYAQNLDVGGNVEFNDLTVDGNLTVTGNIIQIGNIVTDSKTIQLANTAGTANAANGSGVTVGANDNIATMLYSSSANVWTTNIGMTVAGNITGSYFVGNGSLLTGITSYGNANVAAYLPTYTGNLAAGNLTVSSAGNTWTIADQFLTAPGGAYWHSHPEQSTDDFVGAPGSDISIKSIDTNSVVESQINLTGTDIELVVINGVTKTWRFNESGVSEVPGDITPVLSVGSSASVGNVSNPWTNAYFSGNVSAGNVSLTGTVASNLIPIGNNTQSLGNATNQWSDLWVSNATIFMNGVPITLGAGNVLTVNGEAVLTNDSNTTITTTGNITADYFFGSSLTGTSPSASVSLNAFSPDGNTVNIQAQGNTSTAVIETYANATTTTNTWLFDNTGNLTLPDNGNINGADGQFARFQSVDEGIVRSGVILNPGDGLARLESWDNGTSQGFTSADWTSATYVADEGGGYIAFIDAPNILNLANSIEVSRLELQVNGGTFMPYQGFNTSGNNITFFVTTAPVDSPETVIDFTMAWADRSRMEMDYDEGELNIQAQGLDITINGNQDVDIRSSDRIRLENSSTNNGITISTDTANAFHTWTFDPTGNLNLPQSGVVYETNIPVGGLTGKTIALKPYGGTDADQQLLVYPTAGADANHLHLTSGNLYNTELFLGNDDLYVKLANTGNIVINSNDGNNNTAQWTFGTAGTILNSGNLTLQTPSGIPTSLTNWQGQGGWNQAFYSNVATTGGTGTGLTVDVAAAGAGYISINDITINTPGTGYTNGDVITIDNENNLPGTFTVGVVVNNWTFDTTGVLTVPGNIVMPAGSSLVGNGASPAPNISGFNSATFGANVTATGNISGGNISATGNISGNTAGYAIGYRDIPQVSFTGNATIATTDAGKHFYSTQSTNYTLTIANNASQGFQVGAAITVVNQGTGTITIAQGADVTLYLAGNATSGNRSVATFGMATIMKVATDTWFINGTGVS